MPKKLKLQESSGNVFADIGFGQAEAAARLERSRLMVDVVKELRGQKKTQHELGQMLGIGQSRVSDLMQGKARLFSIEMLITFATKLGMNAKVELRRVRPVQAPVAQRVVRPTATVSHWSEHHSAGWTRDVYRLAGGTEHVLWAAAPTLATSSSPKTGQLSPSLRVGHPQWQTAEEFFQPTLALQTELRSR